MDRECFPVSIVEFHNEKTSVQKAKRTPGTLKSKGEFEWGKNPAECKIKTGSKSGKDEGCAASVFNEGLQYLAEFQSANAVADVLNPPKKSEEKVTIAWMQNHDVILDVLPGDDAVIRIDLDWLEACGVELSGKKFRANDPLFVEGIKVLAALTLVHACSLLNGNTQRESIHSVLDVADLLPDTDLDALDHLLRSHAIDSNNSFSLFLEGVRDKELALELEQLDLRLFSHVRTPVLYEVGNLLEHQIFRQKRGGESVDTAKSLNGLSGKKNGKVIGKDEVTDLVNRIQDSEGALSSKSPSEMAQVMERTLKWRDKWVSWLIGQMRVDMPYDQTRVVRLMEEEIEDIDEKRALINEAISSTYDLEQEGSNILRLSKWARENSMRMVAGRLSRAFGNQAQLLSVAKILADKAGLLPSAKKLYKLAMEVPQLQTQAARLLHLIQQTKPTPFSQTIGALNRFEEALFAYQSKEFKTMLREKDEASRRMIGRPDADMCGEVLDTIQERIRELYRLAANFRDQLEQTEKSPAAYTILMQRLHPAETINLANANLFREVHPGKEEDLRDLVRQGGHYTYSSPGLGRVPVIDKKDETTDTNWIIQVDDWIEAIPLFIHERVVKRTVEIGNEEVTIELIETEVDQEAMEAFFRFHAEFWARNIDAVMDSEHVGLARRLLVQTDPSLCKAVNEIRQNNPDKNDDDAAWEVLADQSDIHEGIAALGVLVADAYRRCIDEVGRLIELKDISRIDAVERALPEFLETKEGASLNDVLRKKTAKTIASAAQSEVEKGNKKMAAEMQRLMPYVDRPTRKVPSLHILTTESAGMTEGYVQTWIEEEIALFNVIRNHGLEDKVKERMNQFRTRILSVGKKVIDEFGMGVVVDEVMAQQRLPEPAAVMTVLTSFKPVMQEAAKLAVLIEQSELEGKGKPKYDNASDPKAVDDYLTKHKTELMKIAVPKVAENNGKAFERRVMQIQEEKSKLSLYQVQKKVIESETDYTEELDALIRFEARSRVLEKLIKEYPERKLQAQLENYIRVHTMLAKSTARKQIIAEKKIHDQTQEPLNYYQATGGNKRYNLLYTPSRVNLGERERDSVVKWSQWVGGADRWAAQAGFEFYSLINEGGVEERPALAYAEIQKTSENALCVTHFAGSNALALLCMAVLEGDVEDMADQMNLREDRMIPPAGEGYGGYCVPKDGLFLAFVLSLKNEVKLRQIGIPERFHKAVMDLAKEVLLHQNDFECHFDWQKWAAKKLLTYKQLNKFFDLKEDILVFHINKIARAVENLGQPWHETADGSKLLANLAAQWGVEKMIIRAEQVNRFMVFYKAWMIYDAIREAHAQNASSPSEDNAVVALTAEYKPVQDVRYSTGMRLFEILAQTGEHLTYSLDEEGQNLAYIMTHGFDPDTEHPVGKRAVNQIMQTMLVSRDDKETINRLKEAFPPHKSPGDLIMTSVTMSSTQDMLFYVSDTKLDEIGNQVQVILGDYGLTEDQIRANATVHGGHLREWAGIKQLPKEEQDELIEKVGGQIHALVLQMRGPGRDYEKDVQGIDVLNTGIPFPELLELLDDMPRLIALMRNGNPNSSLAITDGAAGRARRAMTYLDIMLFFAACEKIGRQGVYRAIGLGKSNIERIREDMQKRRSRAEKLFNAVAEVTEASSDKQKETAAEEALALYRSMREEITATDEAGKALREEEKMKRYKKWKKRDYYISQALAKISAGLPLQDMDFFTWVAGIGGIFAVNGEPEGTIQEKRDIWERNVKAITKIAGKGESVDVKAFTKNEQEDAYTHLIRPEFVPETQRFAQQMLVESSSKAVEIAAREALERRKALKVRAERARAFNDREDGFRETFKEDQIPAFAEGWKNSMNCLSEIKRNLDKIYQYNTDDSKRRDLQSNVNRTFGCLIGHTRSIFHRLFVDLMPESNADERSLKRQILEDLSTVFTGREIIFEDLKKLAGGYEDIGAIARLAEAAQDDLDKLNDIAKAIEFFYITFALAQTLEFVLALPEDVDVSMFWKNITDFFAETINDHWYEYWPWAYSRGIGFRNIPTDEKYEMAVERHAWLYEYLRTAMIERTEMKDWAKADQDALLGNFTENKKVVAIGANAPSEVERRWRAYNQLREIAFIKTDGFPLPEVFEEFDPDIIEADKRVNLGILFPVGRTHVSRALREGPTINKELQAEKHSGANIVITRYNDFAEVEGAQKKVILLTDGHFYISEKEYVEALKKSKGLNKSELNKKLQKAKAEGALTPKGIRIAARFTKKDKQAPIVAGSLIPFHGLPIYIEGYTEEEGIPATIQSSIYTDLTYDKSLYPKIFTKESGVQLPPEIDWLYEWNQGLTPEKIRECISEGMKDKGYLGLREFAKQHAIVLIKGAAESGARNLKVFDLQDERARINEEELENAVDFIYDVSRSQSVVIQTALLTTPEVWASESLMQRFVDRQVLEWNTPVNRDSYPKSQIYGSARIVASSSHPKKKYDTAFPISLISLQVATNVGRGGTLEQLLPEFIQEKYRKQILEGLHAEGPKVMNAMNEYVKKHGAEWEKAKGRTIGEDLRGVSYGWANYLMSDYLISPIFKRPGRLVDIEPFFDEEGNRIGSKPILQDEEGRFEGEIVDWQFIHLEPNVGIGLWDRYNLREEVNEAMKAKREKREYNWNNIGVSDRIVLKNFILSGEDYLKANFGNDGIERKAIQSTIE